MTFASPPLHLATPDASYDRRMTFRDACTLSLGGAVLSLLAGLAFGGAPRIANARGEAERTKTVLVPCDRRLPRSLLGGDGGEDAVFAVHEFPGKSAAELGRVRVLARLREVQSPHPTYTENAPVLLRDGAVMVACDAQGGSGMRGAASPAIESVLLVLPD